MNIVSMYTKLDIHTRTLPFVDYNKGTMSDELQNFFDTLQ